MLLSSVAAARGRGEVKAKVSGHEMFARRARESYGLFSSRLEPSSLALVALVGCSLPIARCVGCMLEARACIGHLHSGARAAPKKPLRRHGYSRSSKVHNRRLGCVVRACEALRGPPLGDRRGRTWIPRADSMAIPAQLTNCCSADYRVGTWGGGKLGGVWAFWVAEQGAEGLKSFALQPISRQEATPCQGKHGARQARRPAKSRHSPTFIFYYTQHEWSR